ncbi:MAG: polyphosphate:AMP phosphotransferase [Thermoanaerobaculia bacterium]|nr:polyphosphate:AMP phosphotransferase [Thermoanaerobaculia bacterium]
MFESAELGRKLSKEEYAAELPALRARLLAAQFALRTTRVPVIVVIAGADGSGKGDTVNRLLEWLDPRGVETNVFGPRTDEERDRPAAWRFWRTLPARGRIGIFFGSWYTEPILRRTIGKMGRSRFDADLARVAFFEKELAKDGALFVKCWFHLSKDAQKKRLRKFEKDPETRFKVTRLDWKHFGRYDRFVGVAERALRTTDTPEAPWTIVEAADDRWRDLAVGRALAEALAARLAAVAAADAKRAAERKAAEKAAASAPKKRGPKATTPAKVASAPAGVLSTIDLARTVSDEGYRKELPRLQERLSKLAWEGKKKGVSSVAVFEGSDAAGKGGAIRRVTWALDARLYRVIPVAAPTDEERAHHYLWRFWRHIPPGGTFTIYDRSWYGRVLVERVEGFAKEEEWKRAYLEINDFEAQLVESGIALSKLWLHISPEEQLRRFRERQQVEWKKHKITDEDWRNREKWASYEVAVDEMVARTSTHDAPWTLVSATDKKAARLTVLSTLCDRLEEAL